MHNHNTNNTQQPSFDSQSKQQVDMTSSELNNAQETRPLRSPKSKII